MQARMYPRSSRIAFSVLLILGLLLTASLPALAETSSPRADVAVVIYGGWEGMSVSAWVDNTQQPTLVTAPNHEGNAAALLTLWPPEDEDWEVSVAPVLPAELDPERWEIQLQWIETPDGFIPASPLDASAEVEEAAADVEEEAADVVEEAAADVEEASTDDVEEADSEEAPVVSIPATAALVKVQPGSWYVLHYQLVDKSVTP